MMSGVPQIVETIPLILHDRDFFYGNAIDGPLTLFENPVGTKKRDGSTKTLADTNLIQPYSLPIPRRFLVQEVSVQLFWGGTLLSCFTHGSVYSKAHVELEIDRKPYVDSAALECIDRAAIFPGACVADAAIFLSAVESLRRPILPKDISINEGMTFCARVDRCHQAEIDAARVLLRGLLLLPLL